MSGTVGSSCEEARTVPWSCSMTTNSHTKCFLKRSCWQKLIVILEHPV
jgi:hypothetical protein